MKRIILSITTLVFINTMTFANNKSLNAKTTKGNQNQISVIYRDAINKNPIYAWEVKTRHSIARGTTTTLEKAKN